jgi:hypothetical protein
VPRFSPGAARRRPLLTRRVWLPRWLYEALPALYLLLGAAALAAGILVEGPAWILPLAAVGAIGLVHLGLWVATLRFRHRHRTSPGGAAVPRPGPGLGAGFR